VAAATAAAAAAAAAVVVVAKEAEGSWWRRGRRTATTTTTTTATTATAATAHLCGRARRGEDERGREGRVEERARRDLAASIEHDAQQRLDGGQPPRGQRAWLEARPGLGPETRAEGQG